MTSPYLNRPLRTLTEAEAEIAASSACWDVLQAARTVRDLARTSPEHMASAWLEDAIVLLGEALEAVTRRAAAEKDAA